MISLVRQIRDGGRARILLSSHLLRDVEECCDEILVLKDGDIAANCNLEEERKANRKFIELETRGGDRGAFVEAIGDLGCEYALSGERRVKLIMQESSRSAICIASRSSTAFRSDGSITNAIRSKIFS
jgi:ABC-2 type transport system ATP-binding protein